DRDGVINQFPGFGNYVTNWDEFKFIPGSLEGIRKLSEQEFELFVVSNQAGVSKGLYTEKDLETINTKMLQQVKKTGGKISGIYYCTHSSEDNCLCRKPKTALLEKALKESSLKCDKLFFIGDSFSDMEAARAFGAKTILVLSGIEKISNRPDWKFEPEYVFDNLLLAAHYLSLHYA
ncbi:MAG: HAD family hydrolase, partial [Candidatus Omnitrophica bacterium]|nr:HAD family hydrolase [Candidatus Omnitrophota bacterium]